MSPVCVAFRGENICLSKQGQSGNLLSRTSYDYAPADKGHLYAKDTVSYLYLEVRYHVSGIYFTVRDSLLYILFFTEFLFASTFLSWRADALSAKNGM